MRKEYNIGLFFILTAIVALIAVLLWKRHTMSGFPQEDGGIQQEAELQNAPVYDGKKAYGGTGDTSQVQKMEAVTTCDTVCIYEDIDKKDGAVSIVEAKLPAKYIGLRRDELEAALADAGGVLTLEDREKGFQSQHLELFSPEKVKILRIYDTTEELSGFYIMEVGGEVCVFEKDKTTLYFKTGLKVEDLPADVRCELEEGKFMDTELQVYHFIESYSS